VNIPSTEFVVKDFLARQRESHVRSRAPGAEGRITEYDGSVAQLTGKFEHTPKEFREVDQHFRSVADVEKVREQNRKLALERTKKHGRR